jgi:hypothetical protein
MLKRLKYWWKVRTGEVGGPELETLRVGKLERGQMVIAQQYLCQLESWTTVIATLRIVGSTNDTEFFPADLVIPLDHMRAATATEVELYLLEH